MRVIAVTTIFLGVIAVSFVVFFSGGIGLAELINMNAKKSANPCGKLVLDTETGLCMEQSVWDLFNNVIHPNLQTCADCSNLPVPVISLNNGTQTSTFAVYLSGRKLLDWVTPGLTADSIVQSDSGNVLPPGSTSAQILRVTGTNSIRYLIPSEGQYFQNRYEVLSPQKTTEVHYDIVKKTGVYGSAYFFVQAAQPHVDMDAVTRSFDAIALSESRLANLSKPDPYYVLAMPYLIGGVFGGEGDFYVGNHILEANFGGEKYSDMFPTVLTQEASHEYVHDLQDKMNLEASYTASFWVEGMADAVSIFSGFRTWNDVGFGTVLEPGCSDENGNASEPHSLGRCVFKHLDQEHYLTADFFRRLFHPQGQYPGLNSCTSDFSDPTCISDLTKLLTFLTGKDMRTFVQTALLKAPPTIDPSKCKLGAECLPQSQIEPCFTPPKKCSPAKTSVKCGTNNGETYLCQECKKGSFLDSSHHHCE